MRRQKLSWREYRRRGTRCNDHCRSHGTTFEPLWQPGPLAVIRGSRASDRKSALRPELRPRVLRHQVDVVGLAWVLLCDTRPMRMGCQGRAVLVVVVVGMSMLTPLAYCGVAGGTVRGAGASLT